MTGLRSFTFAPARLAGLALLVARTGYTGEDGFELLVPNAVAAALWDALLVAGEPLGLVPAGLAARGATAIDIVPVFMAAGAHVRRDLPQLAAAALERHPQLARYAAGVLGRPAFRQTEPPPA